MLENFFKMNEPYKEFESKEALFDFLENSKDLRDYLFRPDNLSPIEDFKKHKIFKTKFTNVSFSKTAIERLIFIDCVFEDCLFIGSKLEDCEFHKSMFAIWGGVNKREPVRNFRFHKTRRLWLLSSKSSLTPSGKL